MNLVLIQSDHKCLSGQRMLVHALRHPLLSAMLELYHQREEARVLYALPASLHSETCLRSDLCSYSETEQILTSWIPSMIERPSWICISQGASISQIDEVRVASLLSKTKASVVCLGVDEQLTGHREQIRYTREGCIVGFRRHYEDSAVVVPSFENWPSRIYIRNSCVDHFASLPLEFDVFKALCRTHQIQVQSFNVAGLSYDLNTPDGLLGLVRSINNNEDHVRDILTVVNGYQCLSRERSPGPGPRVIGKVWVSSNSQVSPEAVLISPVVVSDQVNIESRAVLDSSIIGPNVRIMEKTVVSHRVFDEDQGTCYQAAQNDELWLRSSQQSRFLQWSNWAYINTLKRAVDIGIASIVLILFLPIFPVIALAIKINSPGPLFYRARRQGLYGVEFDCLKFRTMKVGADQLQDRLRIINEVDGPQFKMADDPRISAVGRFLRETYLDEIPQFINVLKGEMSVVGPRPSPKSENTQCPRWRDARLSVRPGVTGLWQLLRTREPLRDFQEWIHYDMDYVRRVSSRLDLWICWKTFLQMLGKFVEQF